MPPRLLPAALLLLAALRPAAAQSVPRELADLAPYVERTLRVWGIPGAAIAVVRGDSLVYARGFGRRCLCDSARVDPETMFAIGSISKSFTALALGLLVDEGRLGWDDRVRDRLPGFTLADPDASRETTIRDLLSHRTGLPGENLVFWGSDVPRAEIVRRMRYLPLAHAPRTAFEYQNLAFVAAGEVAAAAAGSSWDDLVERRIFAPLGMRRATTRVGSLSRFPNVAAPHAPAAGGGALEPIPWLDLDNAGAAGSIVASVLDMARYASVQLGRGASRGRRLFSDSVAAQMHAGSTIVPRSMPLYRVFADAHFVEYGLGWFTQDYHDQLIVTHGGQTDGMHANLAIAPELGLGIVVLTNSVLFGYPSAITYRILDAYMGRPARDWSAEFAERLRPVNAGGGPPPARVAGTTPSIPAADLVGRYHQDYLGDAVVRLDGGALMLSMLGRELRLEHWHYDTYRPAWRDAMPRALLPLVTFERDGVGRVRALRFDRVGEFVRQR